MIPKSPIPWECCGEIQCICNEEISQLSYPSNYQNEIQDSFSEKNLKEIHIPAYNYPIPELVEIYEENITIKQVIAN